MKPAIIIIALLNLMISCNFDILPALSVSTGPLLSTIIIILTGFLSFYSCFLYLEHLGNYEDMDEAIQYHFWDSKIAKAIYNISTFIFFLVYLNTFYGLIVLFWDVSFPNQKSVLNPIFNAIGLAILICMLKYFNYATKIIAYGSAFIFISCILLIWVFVSAPPGNNRPPLIGTDIPQITVFMGVGYQIQQIFVPILRYLPKKKARYIKMYTVIVYLTAGVIYIFSSFVGCFGLINRKAEYPLPLTIFSYFPPQIWEIKFLYCLSVLTFYSSFGEIMIIMKKRFFAFLNAFYPIKNTNPNEFFTIPELIFVFALMGLYLGLQLGEVKVFKHFIPFMFVLTFIYFYLVPAVLQFKCLYFERPKVVFNIVFKQKQGQIIKKNHKDLSVEPVFSINSHPSQKTYKTNFGNQQMNQKISIFLEQKPEQINHEGDQNKTSVIYKEKISQISKTNRQGLFEQENTSGTDSLANQTKQLVSIQTLNEVCPAKLPIGWWKVLDLSSIFAMLALGMYVMIENLKNPSIP